MPWPLASPLRLAPLALPSVTRRARDQLALLSPLHPVTRRPVPSLAPVFYRSKFFYLALLLSIISQGGHWKNEGKKEGRDTFVLSAVFLAAASRERGPRPGRPPDVHIQPRLRGGEA